MSMRWIGILAAAFTISITAGCAGGLFPKNFDPATGQSIIVFADHMPNAGVNGYLFRRIDRSTNQFVGPPVSALLYPLSYWQLGQAKGGSGAIFSVMSDKHSARLQMPGDYALIGVGNSQRSPDTVISGVVALGRDRNLFKCLADGAPVFTLGAGEIVIVPLQPLGVSDDQLAAEFKQVRAAYSKMQGKARVAGMKDTIKFGEASMDQAACTQVASFRVE
jgi:hypothetical protein